MQSGIFFMTFKDDTTLLTLLVTVAMVLAACPAPAAPAPATGENSKSTLETSKDYDTGGRSAPITFTAEDHRGNRSLRLFQVKDGKWEQLPDFLTAE